MAQFPGVIFVSTPGHMFIDGDKAEMRSYTSEVYEWTARCIGTEAITRMNVFEKTGAGFSASVFLRKPTNKSKHKVSAHGKEAVNLTILPDLNS